MKILVTGGAGFIGSHTIRRLIEEGNEIICVDDFNDYYDPAIKEQNIAGFASHFVLERCDIRDKEKINKIFRKHQPSHAILLAARAGVRPSIKDPALYHDVNINGTCNLLEAACKTEVENIVFASSSSVYGGSKNIPFNESEWPISPISPYAATKLGGENLCRYYHQQYGLNTTCLRFFTVYGPSGRPDMAPYIFTDKIYKGEAIQRFGNGTTKRDYTYVSDIVSGVISAIKKPLGYEVLNIGNNKPIELNVFIAIIEKLLGKQAIIETLPEQPGDVPMTYANIEKAKQFLGYEPTTSIEKGMKEFVDWYLKSDQSNA